VCDPSASGPKANGLEHGVESPPSSEHSNWPGGTRSATAVNSNCPRLSLVVPDGPWAMTAGTTSGVTVSGGNPSW
jgi:hypothetical protein